MVSVVAHLRPLLDIFSIKIFVWIFGRNGESLDSHLFLFDKYSDLADYHRSRGRIARADKLAAIAELHFELAPDDDPPEAAAMAVEAAPRKIRTTAVATAGFKKSSRQTPEPVEVSW